MFNTNDTGWTNEKEFKSIGNEAKCATKYGDSTFAILFGNTLESTSLNGFDIIIKPRHTAKDKIKPTENKSKGFIISIIKALKNVELELSVFKPTTPANIATLIIINALSEDALNPQNPT